MANKKQIALILLFAGMLLWSCGIKRPAYQYWYGKKGEVPLMEADKEFISDTADGSVWHTAFVNGYEIAYRVRKHYSVAGRIVYADRYDGFFKTWYHSAGRKAVKLYNAVAPFDLSVVHGETAADGNWQKIDFSHEERALFLQYRYEDKPTVKREEINNNHIIPATLNIRRAIEILKTGEPVYIEGYLVDWKGSGKFAGVEFKTALEPGEFSDLLLGGDLTGLCRQLLVTKIGFDGYVFE